MNCKSLNDKYYYIYPKMICSINAKISKTWIYYIDYIKNLKIIFMKYELYKIY